MEVRIVGVDPPGRTCCDRADIHVGVQRRAEVVERFPADVAQAVWDLHVDVAEANGQLDFRGPHVQGPRGERFIYLSWDAAGPDGNVQMFRRAKLMLAAIDPETVRRADRPGSRLVGTLRLTGADGSPRCAAVRPPAIGWDAVS